MKKLVALFALALLLSVLPIGLSIYEERRKADSDDPSVWEDDISAFEEADRATIPARDAILFVGGSSVRLWHTLAQDMAPLSTIRRGFGGARMPDVVYYADRLINRYTPEKVVIVAGSTDIELSAQALEAVPIIRDGLQQLIWKILENRPDTDIFYIAITPTPASWEKWQAVQAANAAAESVCASQPRCHFIATADLFLDEEGEPDKHLYQFDGLHPNTEGYQRWTQRIKPLLLVN
jgi:lysophospholipase L1-like esterase